MSEFQTVPNETPVANPAAPAAVPVAQATESTAELEIDLGELLDLAIAKEASDIHFGAESRIGLRIFGEIRFVDAAGMISKPQAEKIIYSLLKSEDDKHRLKDERELDFSYEHTDGTTFRCHAFYRRGRIAMVMRRIAKSVPAMSELGLPPAVQQLAKAKQGMILVCGPTGSGKSTTLFSLLEEINATRVEHVVTIEDPIEYVFRGKKCVFSQRELGDDTHSFDRALRGAMREDPDIVMVGEMRDRETITSALNLCETGHLVLSTLHTNSGPKTISRLTNSFPLEQREPVLSRIADTLLAVVSQRLIPKIGGGRVGLYEIMLVNSAVKNAIRQGDISQIENTIATSADAGMVSVRRAAEELINRGLVTPESVQPYIAHDE